jgi:hypothetical protein
VRAAEVALVAVMAVVLPATVRSAGLYLACAAPCLVAAIVLGYLDGRTGRR